jgi:rhodanese-related sulfurtransferase
VLGGYTAWQASPATIPSIDVDTAAADRDRPLLDVREYEEWMSGRAPHAVHIPMSELVRRVGELDPSRPIACICRSGNRSAQVTGWLRRQGFDAVNVAGGMSAWAAHGHAVVNHAGNPGVVI